MRSRHPDSHVVLVLWDDHWKTVQDLNRIAARIPEIDPAIGATVVAHHRRDQLKLFPLWFRPTLSISMNEKLKSKWLPGRFMTGRRLHKHGEYQRLDAAGIAVPRWEIITPEMRLDPAEWGPYVVEKPSCGRAGALVRIRRTGRIQYVDPETLPQDHYGRIGPMLAQKFVYTGPWPTSYRVVTLYGNVLLSYRLATRGAGAGLTRRWDFGGGGLSIVSNTKRMDIELDGDPEIVAFAERAHKAAFPDLPLLAFDIVRDVETGELFVLECHSQGAAWMFSTDQGLSLQADHGVDFESQYDGLDKAARILCEVTPRLAKIRSPLARQATGRA
jgi:hypothetical protein